jgi:hypothetical protein
VAELEHDESGTVSDTELSVQDGCGWQQTPRTFK